MVEINGYDIVLTRGDSLFLRIDLGGRDLPAGAQAVFTLKKTIRSRSVLVQKIFDASEELLAVFLTPEETNLPAGMYVWDVRLQIPLEDGSFEVYTPMNYATFAVLDAVGTDVGITGGNEA